MKKSLLALAVAAALPGVALAQSSVTLSGHVKLGLTSTKFSNGLVAANPNDSMFGMADGSSRFILSGVEDLGGGLKAVFQIDQRFRGDESPASSQANGNTFVGLAGGFGQVRLGKLDLYYGYGTDEHGIRATPLQHSNISILSYVGQSGNAIASASRSLNVVRYDSPKFGGLTFGLAFSPAAQSGEGGANSTPGSAAKGQAYQADLSYAAGPLRAGLALWDHKNEGYEAITGTAVKGQKAARIWGGYNLGVFDIGLTVDQSKLLLGNGSDTKRTAFSLPIKANLGPGVLLFTASVAQNLKTGGTTVADSGARMYVLGYDYALSKRTSLGVSYAVLDNKAAASYALFTGTALGSIQTPTAGQDTKQLYLGIRHAF